MVCTAGSSGGRRPPWEVLPWRRPIVQRPSADCEDDPEPGTRTSRKKGLAQGAAIRRHHQALRQHLSDFVTASNFARRLKTLNGLTSYEPGFPSAPRRRVSPVEEGSTQRVVDCSGS